MEIYRCTAYIAILLGKHNGSTLHASNNQKTCGDYLVAIAIGIFL
jgi:hypothetical protein